MRLRTQFIALVTAGAVLGIGALVILGWTVRGAEQLAGQQRSAQAVGREVLGLLALTQEYVLFGEERAVVQWRRRLELANRALQSADAENAAEAADLREQLGRLPELFDSLVRSNEAPGPVALRSRLRELLIDGLITGTQAIADDAFRWEDHVNARRAQGDRRLTTLAIALPAVLALTLSLGAALLARRVLRPVRELRRAMRRVADGDFEVRSASGARDEIGDLARSFDDMTGRLSASTGALSRSEAWLRSVIESVPARISYVDTDLRFRFVNAAAAEAFERSPADMLGRTMAEVRSPAEWAEMVPRVEAALGGATPHWERVETHSGESRYYEVSLVPEVGAAGQVNGFYAIGFDVTERKRHEEALHAADQRFRTLVDNISDYEFYLLDADGRVATSNPGPQRRRRYGADEIIGQHFRRFFAPEDVASGVPDRELARAAAEGRFETEAWRLRSDGTRLWANEVLTAIHDADGELTGFTKVTRDITERKNQEDLLSRVAEASPSAMLMIDAHGRIGLVNAQAEAMFGLPRSELIGRPIETLMPERFRAAHPGQRSGFMRDASVRTMGAGRELFALRSDGSEFAVDISLAPIATRQGPAVLAAVFDLSERLARQADMQRSLREKEVLLKEIHHRVKNNMQVISSLLQLQSGYLDDSKTQHALAESQNRIKTMALVHEKLYQRHDLASIDMADYVQSLVSMLLSTYGDLTRGVEVAVDAQAITLDVDRAIPAGLILNELISNAFKHAFPQGREGRVEIAIGPTGDGAVRMMVRDDGVGLPQGVDTANSESLGLRLVHILADQLGATMTVAGEQGFVCELAFRPAVVLAKG